MIFLKTVDNNSIHYNCNENGYLRLELRDKEVLSYVSIDLKDMYQGYVCISTGNSLIPRKGYYTTLIEEAKKLLKSLGYSGLYSGYRSGDADSFWESFSINRNVIKQGGSYLY